MDRFSQGYMPEPNTGCWLWAKACKDNGYGMTYLNRSAITAHRCSWILNRGPIPIGMCVCHKCDTPACVNPDHLFLGTNRDNINDCQRKGRSLKGRQFPERRGPRKASIFLNPKA